MPNWKSNQYQTSSLAQSDIDTFTITNLKFYLQDVSLSLHGKNVYRDTVGVKLMDINQLYSLQINYPKQLDFDSIHFQLGLDSTTNVSGILDGNLDPTKGMYWTWQSGYINLKLESKCNKCNPPFNTISLHLGGYYSPFNTSRYISLPLLPSKTIVTIEIDKLLEFAVQNQLYSVMSPGKNAVMLSDRATSIFSTSK